MRGRTRIAVVRRDRHGGDCTLPKGHVVPGEAPVAAARREVGEETGWDAQPTSLLTAITYGTDEGTKYVLFWDMEAVAERGGPARDEVTRCEWLSPSQARKQLTYPEERKVVADLTDRGEPGLVSRVRRSPQRERLAEGISMSRSRLAADHGPASASSPAWLAEAYDALDDAEQALRRDEVDRGWGFVHLVEEFEVRDFDHLAVSVRAATVRAEVASGKFAGWRRAAILLQLEPVLLVDAENHPTRGLEERRARLIEALQNRNEAHSNEYRNIAITRRYQATLLWIAIAILVGALVGATFSNSRFEDGADEGWVAVGAALSGALGGIASALQRTSRRSIERIPERIGSWGSSLSRPAIGAIAGVTVFLAVRAGVTQTATQQQVAYLLLLAFGAGFTERLVVRDPREDVPRDDPVPVPTVPIPASPPSPPTAPVTPPAAGGAGGEDDQGAADGNRL
jgi:8-oxo-dGTP diphosphatase